MTQQYIVIDINSDLDPVVYPIDCDSDEQTAREALRDAGLAYADVYAGDPADGEAVKTSHKLFAAES